MTEEELLEIEVHLDALTDAPRYGVYLRRLIAEVRGLQKGEFICRRCGIRKNGEGSGLSANF